MNTGRTPGTKHLRAIRKGGAWTGSEPHSPLTETPNHSKLFHCQRWNTEFYRPEIRPPLLLPPPPPSILYDILRSIKRSLWYLDILTLRISRGEHSRKCRFERLRNNCAKETWRRRRLNYFAGILRFNRIYNYFSGWREKENSTFSWSFEAFESDKLWFKYTVKGLKIDEKG